MPTVRHTGTLFMVNVLRMYNRITPRGQEKPPTLVCEHVYDTHMARFKPWLEKFSTVVIPLRDPTATAASWARRGEMSDHFFEMWRNIQWFDQFEPFYIPIDLPDKQARLDALAEHLGVPLWTDWTPVNSSPRPPVPAPDVSAVYRLPLVRRFYGEGNEVPVCG